MSETSLRREKDLLLIYVSICTSDLLANRNTFHVCWKCQFPLSTCLCPLGIDLFRLYIYLHVVLIKSSHCCNSISDNALRNRMLFWFAGWRYCPPWQKQHGGGMRWLVALHPQSWSRKRQKWPAWLVSSFLVTLRLRLMDDAPPAQRGSPLLS